MKEQKNNKIVIAIDFDGTCVTHDFPEIGKDIGSVSVLRRIVRNGHKLVLFTMRSDIDDPKSKDYNIHTNGGKYLTEALKWFKRHKIPLYGVNTNPTQLNWTKSPKAYAQLYIDDAALGCPLIFNSQISNRPYVNWGKVEEYLIETGIIKD